MNNDDIFLNNFNLNNEIILKNDNGIIWHNCPNPAEISRTFNSDSMEVYTDDGHIYSRRYILSGVNKSPLLSSIIENDNSVITWSDDPNFDYINLTDKYIENIIIIKRFPAADGNGFIDYKACDDYNIHYVIYKHKTTGNLEFRIGFKVDSYEEYGKYCIKIKLNTSSLKNNTNTETNNENNLENVSNFIKLINYITSESIELYPSGFNLTNLSSSVFSIGKLKIKPKTGKLNTDSIEISRSYTIRWLY